MDSRLINVVKSIPNLSAAYLFGSRARGNYKDDSDYDLCIVISDEDRSAVVGILTEFMLSHKIFIHPLILTQKEFDEKMKISVYRTEILRDGIRLV